MTESAAATVALRTEPACEVSPLLRRITRGEVLSLIGIALFAEMLTVGWIALVLGVDVGRASWAQAAGMAAIDFLSLLWIPVPLFALYDAFPLGGPHGARHLAVRVLGAAVLALVSAAVIKWAALLGGPLIGIEAAVISEIILGLPEQIFWASCSVIGASMAYLVLRRLHLARDLEQRHAELQRLAVEAQLAALSSELRPHFLFNAINNLAELVHHDPPRTESMLLHLSSLLQGTLTAGQRRTVTLAEELTHIDDYLALQQMRFAERLTVVRNVAPEALRMEVPPMLLQPLVENAIEHGIEGRVGASTLWIHAGIVGAQLQVGVEDDGPGPHRSARVGNGVGLRNVRARLNALYGERASATLEERPGGGARMILQLPLEAA